MQTLDHRFGNALIKARANEREQCNIHRTAVTRPARPKAGLWALYLKRARRGVARAAKLRPGKYVGIKFKFYVAASYRRQLADFYLD